MSQPFESVGDVARGGTGLGSTQKPARGVGPRVWVSRMGTRVAPLQCALRHAGAPPLLRSICDNEARTDRRDGVSFLLSVCLLCMGTRGWRVTVTYHPLA